MKVTWFLKVAKNEIVEFDGGDGSHVRRENGDEDGFRTERE